MPVTYLNDLIRDKVSQLSQNFALVQCGNHNLHTASDDLHPAGRGPGPLRMIAYDDMMSSD